MNSSTDALGPLLEALLNRQGLSEKMRGYRLWQHWTQTVGDTIAQQAQPLRIRDGVLEVRVGHPVWMQQLQLLKPKLLKQLNQALGENLLTDLYFRRGAVSLEAPSTSNAPSKAWQSVKLDAEDEAAIEDLVNNIDDPELGRSLRRLMQRQRQLDKYRESE